MTLTPLVGCSSVSVAPPQFADSDAHDRDALPDGQDAGRIVDAMEADTSAVGEVDADGTADPDGDQGDETLDSDAGVTPDAPGPGSLACDEGSQVLSCDGVACISADALGNHICQVSLNCEVNAGDGGDCVCGPGELLDCYGVCRPSAWFTPGACSPMFNCAQVEGGTDGCIDTCDGDQLLACGVMNCEAASLYGDGVCDPSYDCPEAHFDAGDCEPSCATGEVVSCVLSCLPSSLVGDGICDAELSCQALGFDGGDCCPDGQVKDCGGVCVSSDALGDGVCDALFDCAQTAFDSGDCPVGCQAGQQVGCVADQCIESAWLGDGLCDEGYDCAAFAFDNGDCLTCGDTICEAGESPATCGEDCDPCFDISCDDDDNPCTVDACTVTGSTGSCAYPVSLAAPGCTGCLEDGMGAVLTYGVTNLSEQPAASHDIALRPNGAYVVAEIHEEDGLNRMRAQCFDASGELVGTSPALSIDFDPAHRVAAAASSLIGPGSVAFAIAGLTITNKLVVYPLTATCESLADQPYQIIPENFFARPSLVFDGAGIVIAANQRFRPLGSAVYSTCQTTLLTLSAEGEHEEVGNVYSWIPKGLGGPPFTECDIAEPDIDLYGDRLIATSPGAQAASCEARVAVFDRETPDSPWYKDLLDEVEYNTASDHGLRVGMVRGDNASVLTTTCDGSLFVRSYGGSPIEAGAVTDDLTTEFGGDVFTSNSYRTMNFSLVAGTVGTLMIGMYTTSGNPTPSSFPVLKTVKYLRAEFGESHLVAPSFDLIAGQESFDSANPETPGSRLRVAANRCLSRAAVVGSRLVLPAYAYGIPLGTQPESWAIERFAVDDDNDDEPDFCCDIP